MSEPSTPTTVISEFPNAVEPPRKRQRTTERDLASPVPAVCATYSPASSPTTPAEADVSSPPSMSTLLTSTHSPSYRTSSTHTLHRSDAQVGVSATSALDSGGAGPSNASGIVPGRSSATCQSGPPPFRRECDDQGDTGGFQTCMKGMRFKGKAREAPPSPTPSTTPTLVPPPATEDIISTDSQMAWEPPRAQPVGQEQGTGACATACGFRGTDFVGKYNSGQGHAASGARLLAKPSVIHAADHCIPSMLYQDEEDEPPVRDEEYYIDSADCVIRVDNTLFRVHRYFLGRDSSAFQHMFSMPAEGFLPQNMEGCSDENPIRLFGESAERFRALLSVIYDLPLQLQAYNTPRANVDRLLTIAEMTNKYHFASIETWAVDALYNVITGLHGPPQRQYELGHCSSEWMKRLLEVALLCGHTQLRDYVAERWVERIVARDLRPVHALELADRGRLRRLQGFAYYVQLLEMGDNLDPGVAEDGKQYSRSRPAATAAVPGGDAQGNGQGNNAKGGTLATLTREEKQRLLSGYWSLTRLWEQHRATPPKFQRPEGCTYHQHGCLTTWAQVWREVGKSELTLRHPPADVLGRLGAMEEQLFLHADLSCALTPQCKRGAILALKAVIRDVQDGLAGHFADLTSVAAEGGS